MVLFQIPDWVRVFFKGFTWRKDPSKKVIYLTFDDGPVPEVTPLVLDILDQYGVKATFFMVGDNVRKHPDVYQDVVRRGHHVGSHSYNHLQGLHCGVRSYVANVKKTNDMLGTKLFRPPHGRMRSPQMKLLKREGYEVVLWDVLANDWSKWLKPDYILKNVKRHTRNGSIIVFHDSIKAQHNMLPVLPEVIKWWKEQGYEFGVL